MIRIAISLSLVFALAACGGGFPFGRKAANGPAEPAGIGLTRPMTRPSGLGNAPPPGARTAEEFDTTTAAEREAAKAPSAGGAALGSTVAGLGDPTRAGFWLETPLVTAEGPGRVVYAKSGASAQVLLIPIDGAATAGSRLSLAAMRVLGVPLTELVELQVFAGQ